MAACSSECIMYTWFCVLFSAIHSGPRGMVGHSTHHRLLDGMCLHLCVRTSWVSACTLFDCVYVCVCVCAGCPGSNCQSPTKVLADQEQVRALLPPPRRWGTGDLLREAWQVRLCRDEEGRHHKGGSIGSLRVLHGIPLAGRIIQLYGYGCCWWWWWVLLMRSPRCFSYSRW